MIDTPISVIEDLQPKLSTYNMQLWLEIVQLCHSYTAGSHNLSQLLLMHPGI